MGSVNLICCLMLLCFGAINAHYYRYYHHRHSYHHHYYQRHHEVGFSAALSSSQYTGVIKYNKVYLNYGHGLHTDGKFYAPSTGLYSFTYTTRTYTTGYSLTVYLYHNSAIVSRSYAYNSKGQANGGGSAVIWLRSGDKVWTYANTYIYGGYYTTFSGFMISSSQYQDQDQYQDQAEQALPEMKDQPTMDLADDEPAVDDGEKIEN